MLIFNFRVMSIAVVLAIASPAGSAWALLTVEASNAPGIEVDAQFSDDHVFNVPAGAKVQLIKTPGKNPKGDTHTIKGDYQGTLDDYIRRECWRPGVNCGPLNKIGGGTKGIDPGAVRAAPPPKQ